MTPVAMHLAGSIRCRQAQSGMTLIELVVVILITFILVALAIPSFQSMINASRVSSLANELVATLQLARMEAFRRGERTIVCRSDNPDSATPMCSSGPGNWGGWLAFVDSDGSGSVTGPDIILRTTAVADPTVAIPSEKISTASNRIVFRPDGLAREADGSLLLAQVRFCVPTTLPPENARDVAISGGARISVLRRNTAGACPAPANS